MSHDIFISHSSRDKPVGDAVCAVLEARGHRCWIAPRDILPGREWGEAIIGGIRGARAFVLIFSGNANESHQVRREVERASSLGLPVIPFRIEDVEPSSTLEYFMSSPHWLDALTPPLQAHLDYLADVVDHLLSASPSTPPIRPPRSRAPGQPPAAALRSRVDAAIMAGFALVGVGIPLLASLARMEPPWPPAIAWISAAILIAALLIGRALSAGLSARRRHWLMIGAAVAACVGLFAYLMLYASFVMVVPGGDRVVLGYRCNEMGQLMHPTLCPHLDESILQTAEWDPSNLFTSSSILVVRMSLVASWLIALLGLVGAAAWAIGARTAPNSPAE